MRSRPLGLLAAAAAFLLPLLALVTPHAPAQDDKPVSEKDKGNDAPPFDPKAVVDGGLGMLTPYDKFIALDQALGKAVDWKQYFARTKVDVDVDDTADTKVALPVLLGCRLSDGAVAIKAHDAELLNQCASDIEAMAKKLGVGEGELARAKKVRAAANSGEWPKVFLDLGFLQQDIMKTLGRGENKAPGTLVVVAGWLQGARYVTAVIKDNYSPAASNFLREPLLVDTLVAKLKTLPEDARNSPVADKMLSALQEIKGIVDIGTDGSIPPDKVDRIKILATDVVTSARSATKP